MNLYATWARHLSTIETGVTYALYVLCAVVWAACAVSAFGLSFLPNVAEWTGMMIAGWLW